jgi:D-arabinose 1-dehydrogenase-like Zn-dependent alcohol dehydrogenase
MAISSHSGVCHSDMGVMLNAWKTLPFPTQAGQVGGHEGVGKIVKMGPGTENSAVKMGDRVGIKWMAGICEACEACRAGMDASCFSGVSVSGFDLLEVLANQRIRKSQDTTHQARSSNTSSALRTTSHLSPMAWILLLLHRCCVLV